MKIFMRICIIYYSAIKSSINLFHSKIFNIQERSSRMRMFNCVALIHVNAHCFIQAVLPSPISNVINWSVWHKKLLLLCGLPTFARLCTGLDCWPPSCHGLLRRTDSQLTRRPGECFWNICSYIDRTVYMGHYGTATEWILQTDGQTDCTIFLIYRVWLDFIDPATWHRMSMNDWK